MAEAVRDKYLRLALLLVGLIFMFGIYPLTIIWPSGWAWHTSGQSEIFADDLRSLRDAWGIPADRFSHPPRTPIAYLVHRVVERRAWRHHGGTISN
jgi:hypothetical protein